MGLYPAFFGLLLCRLRPKISPLFLAPVAWVALDGLRAFLFTGFPWLDLAYTQYRSPLPIQVADLTGHYGVTFLIVLVNVLLLAGAGIGAGKKLFPCPGKMVLAAVLTIIAAFSYSGWRFLDVEKKLAGAETTGVAIIQGNIPQDEKWQAMLLRQSVATYIKLSAGAVDQGKTDLVIWPETAFPYFPAEHPIFQEVVENLLEPHGVFLLSGAPHREPDQGGRGMRYFNSAFLFAPGGTIVGRYDKQHLVPFGEYIPFRKLFSFASPLVETLGDFTPGQSHAPLPGLNNRIGVLICFESIFPELSRKMAANGATILANLTNDAWFGKSNAPWQHLSMSVLRAVETRRSLARAANTGFSCFIDPLGRISGQTGLFETRSLTARLPLFSETTFYVKYGHLFLLSCLLVLLGEILRNQVFFRQGLEKSRQNENIDDQEH
jgi:apolipoprotein N-acyltransferase